MVKTYVLQMQTKSKGLWQPLVPKLSAMHSICESRLLARCDTSEEEW
jgi:hypothetical protein